MKTIRLTILMFVIISTMTSCKTTSINGTFYGWPDATGDIKAAMITPMLVNKNNSAVKKQARQLKESKHFNSVASLIDLQSGRNYIFPGRNATALSSGTKKNIETVLREGITPILIIRNDWAARTGTGSIPSVNGQIGNAQFYNSSLLASEKKFVESLESYYKFIHIQINIEPDRDESANFALELARHLRANGFKNQIIINPILKAESAHDKIRSKLNEFNVKWARSRANNNFGSDPIINSDGNASINKSTFKDYLNRVKSDGREYIIWCNDFSNISDSIPEEYLK